MWIYGRHAVGAALFNPERRIHRVLATKNAVEWLRTLEGAAKLANTLFTPARPDEIDHALPAGAVHQGLAAEVEGLTPLRLDDICNPATLGRPVLVLDQITDPHNIGAIFRSAAAFGVCAVIVQDRRTPPLSGALAKAAAGAIESVPCLRVVNIARTLEALKELGYHCAGLAGDASALVRTLPADRPVAVVLGAEGAGLRDLVRKTCDGLYKIPITPAMDSLNVSNAAAITLYEAIRGRKTEEA